MKKKIAIILCFIMVTMSLAGCSQAELDYLNMGREMSSQSYKMTGNMTGEIDFDALAVLINEASAQMKTPEGQEGNPAMDLQAMSAEELFGPEMQGKKKIKIDYSGLVDMSENMVMQLDLGVQFDGKTYDMGDMYFDAGEGVYLSKNMMMGAYDLCKDMMPEAYSPYFYSAAYRDEIVKIFGTNEYIHVGYFDQMSEEESAQMKGMMNSAYSKEINDAAYDFIEKAFAGFTTGTVSKVGSGFQIALDGKQGKKLFADMLQHFIDNIDTVMAAYKDYMLVTLTGMPGMSEEEVVAAKAELEAMFTEENQFIATIVLSTIKQAFTDADAAGQLDFLNGFNYKATVKEVGEKAVTQEDVALKAGKKTAISLKSTGEVVVQPVTVTLPTGGIAFEQVKKGIDAIENKYNPLQTAKIDWWNDAGEGDFAMIEFARDKKSPFAGKRTYDAEQYFLQDRQLYLPLRSVAEEFGETVSWDQQAKKAYIVRGDRQIEMTGILKDGKTYVKVRDFEKLGYGVSYEYDQEIKIHTAKITR